MKSLKFRSLIGNNAMIFFCYLILFLCINEKKMFSQESNIVDIQDEKIKERAIRESKASELISEAYFFKINEYANVTGDANRYYLHIRIEFDDEYLFNYRPTLNTDIRYYTSPTNAVTIKSFRWYNYSNAPDKYTFEGVTRTIKPTGVIFDVDCTDIYEQIIDNTNGQINIDIQINCSNIIHHSRPVFSIEKI